MLVIFFDGNTPERTFFATDTWHTSGVIIFYELMQFFINLALDVIKIVPNTDGVPFMVGQHKVLISWQLQLLIFCMWERDNRYC